MYIKTLELSSLMPFGKYKDEQVEDLIYDQPRYITWCYENEVVSFDVDVIRKLEDRKLI